MRPAISLLTAAAVWVHLLLGCCSHHAHGAAEDHCISLDVELLAAEHHGHSHGHEHPTPEPRESPTPGQHHNDCHESHCSFVLAAKTKVSPDTLVVALGVAAQNVSPQVATTSSNWRRDTGDHLQLPVRLHLFNRVLLI